MQQQHFILDGGTAQSAQSAPYYFLTVFLRGLTTTCSGCLAIKNPKVSPRRRRCASEWGSLASCLLKGGELLFRLGSSHHLAIIWTLPRFPRVNVWQNHRFSLSPRAFIVIMGFCLNLLDLYHFPHLPGVYPVHLRAGLEHAQGATEPHVSS